jgi:hypothetical protein
MNCTELASSIGWECYPAGQQAVRAISPLTLGEDGQCAAFYIASPTEDTFFLTDASETAIHAEQMGIALSKKRLNSLNKTFGVSKAHFEFDGAITAWGNKSELQEALWDALKLALSLSFKSPEWKPKFAQEKFQAIVYRELVAQLGAERVIKDVKVMGASGNTIAFPVGVRRLDKQLTYVQPVALENEKLNWSVIYQAHGKFFDVMGTSELRNRVAILEDGASSLDFNRAASFLSSAAEVHTLESTESWDFVFAS